MVICSKCTTENFPGAQICRICGFSLKESISDSTKQELRFSKEVYISGDLFGQADPADGAGLEVPAFRLYQTYEVEQKKAKEICGNLYRYVFKKVSSGGLSDTKILLIKYVESFTDFNNTGGPCVDVRPYIVITRNTLRGTKATILVRFYDYGNHLYLRAFRILCKALIVRV
jgi:hypothetical protein